MQTMNEPAQSTIWLNTVSYNNSQGLPKTQAIAKGISVQGPPKLKPVWPPSFDTDGGAYIFQSQSGSFLEPKSQFFYCPKSKLYYSCTNGIYYNQVVLQGEISFVRFNPPLPIEPEGTSTLSDQSAVSSTAAATAAAAAAAALIRKPVILSMGFGMKNKNSSVKINNVSKKIAGDMLKWGSAQGNEDEEEMKRTEKAQMILVAAARGKGKSANANIPIMQSDTNVEVNIEDQTINALALTSRINSASNNIAPSIAMTGKQVTPISSSSTAPTGASEVVACLLCRRQFSTPEQLGRHERESKLHKENMMLMVAATSNDIAKQLAAFSTSTATIPSATAAPNSIPLSSQSASMNTLVPQMPTFSVPLNSIPTAMVSTLSFPPPPPPPSFSHPPSSSKILPPTTILLTSTPPNLSSSSSSSSSPHSIRNSVHQSALDSEQINFRENFRDTSGLKEVSSSSEYRDRALERREIHHQSSQSGSIHKDRERERQSDRERDGIDSKGKDRNQERSTSSFQKSEIDSKNGVIQPLDDHHNPGTQMLRKMGWNEGQGLGRSGSGSEESVGVRLAEEMNSNGGGRGGGRRVTGIGGNSGSGIPQVDYRGSGKEYKDSLMRAAKARYDQVSNQ